MAFEKVEYGDFARIIAFNIKYPTVDIAMAKVYANNDSGEEALEQWFDLANKVTSRTMTLKAQMNPELNVKNLMKKLHSVIVATGYTKKLKYNHFVFESNPTRFIDKDEEIKDALVEFLQEQDKANIYEVEAQKSIDLPQAIRPGNKHWEVWTTMLSFLNELTWPFTLTHTIQGKTGTVWDMPVVSDLFVTIDAWYT